jgi:hypothetical protein
MNNWKLRYTFDSNEDSDYVEVNGHLANLSNGDFTVDIIPFGNQFAAALRTGATDTFGPVRNQVPGICNGTFTHTGAGSATVSATTLTGEGSGATFTYTFLADGTLSTIVAASGGSGYLVGDKLRITTSASHGSQVIEFRLVDGSNATQFTVQANHENQTPFPFAVHRARVGQSDAKTLYVFDYRSQQVFPRPQDKLLDKYPDAAAAYGLRLLRSAYLGPAIRVRRAADNAEKDIYFDGQGNLDTADLVAFAGGSSFIRTWYDQSGNGNDAQQTAAASQPRISQLDASLVTVNGKPALDFDGSDDGFSANHTDLYGQARLDVYMHYQTNDNKYIMLDDDGAQYSFVPVENDTATSINGTYGNSDLYVNGVKAALNYGTTTRDQLHAIMVEQGAEHSNGAVVVHEGAATTGWTGFGISDYNNFQFDGKMTEMVLYNTDQSANRENIEKDMALHSGAFQVEDAPLLDAYGGAHAAYSLRKLNSDYTGAAVRIARDSDLAEQDIGFDADGNLDTAAALAFCPSQYGRIKTWYDQSGNGNDTTQSSQAGQPILVEQNNSVITVDGQPALRFFGVDDALPFDNTGLDIGNLSSFAVLKMSNTTGLQRAIQLSGTSGDARWYAPVISGGNFYYNYANTAIQASVDLNNNLHTMIAGATQGDAEAFINGTSIGTATLSSGIATGTGIGGAFSDYANCFIQEVVVYSSDQSERREGIERNISNHYDL